MIRNGVGWPRLPQCLVLRRYDLARGFLTNLTGHGSLHGNMQSRLASTAVLAGAEDAEARVLGEARAARERAEAEARWAAELDHEQAEEERAQELRRGRAASEPAELGRPRSASGAVGPEGAENDAAAGAAGAEEEDTVAPLGSSRFVSEYREIKKLGQG